MLVFAGPAMAHEHTANHTTTVRHQPHAMPQTASAEHGADCARHGHRPSRDAERQCCHGVSTSGSPILSPTLVPPAPPVSLSYGIPGSMAGLPLAAIIPPPKPPRT
ncbi:MAG: hypothetical protein HY055_07675 [Magnetospirillum sp.]|nr:hypothetical protein [Magnetospirillum sp.]